MDHVDFGGFSGFELAPNGVDFIAISDRTKFISGKILREGPKQRIVGVEVDELIEARAPDGGKLGYNQRDTEGLALAPDGSLYVSVEGDGKIFLYKTPDAPAIALKSSVEFSKLISNGSLESLAIDEKGRIYTLPERYGQKFKLRLSLLGHVFGSAQLFPIWRYENGEWEQPFTFKVMGTFLPVGADFGPDGRLYILERNFHGAAGFQSRVRSFAVTHNALSNERVEFESFPGEYDNLEGIAVWRDQRGKIRLTMISDDNFQPSQKTEFVEYALD